MPRVVTSPADLSSSSVKPRSLAFSASPLPGSEPEAELLRDLFAQPAPREVLANRRACIAVPEQALEVGRRLVENRVQPLLPLALGLDPRGQLLHLDRDAETLGEPLDGADEVQALGLAYERDDVASLPAAEAVVELLDRVDRERRSLLLVERAPARVTRPRRTPQLRAPRDDLDHVRSGDDITYRGVLDARHR